MHLYDNSFSQGLAYGKGYWVAYISDPFSQEGKLFRSTGGLVPKGWETVASFEIDVDVDPFMNNLVFHGDNFVAAGAEYFLVSNDGQTWKNVSKDAGRGSGVCPLVYVGPDDTGFFFYFCQKQYLNGNGKTFIWSSKDGYTWQENTKLESMNVTSISYLLVEKMYVAMAELGILYGSTDGISWEKIGEINTYSDFTWMIESYTTIGAISQVDNSIYTAPRT